MENNNYQSIIEKFDEIIETAKKLSELINDETEIVTVNFFSGKPVIQLHPGAFFTKFISGYKETTNEETFTIFKKVVNNVEFTTCVLKD